MPLEPSAPILRGVLAPNPAPRTPDGARRELVGRRQAAAIDPGPAFPEPIDAVARCVDGRPGYAGVGRLWSSGCTFPSPPRMD